MEEEDQAGKGYCTTEKFRVRFSQLLILNGAKSSDCLAAHKVYGITLLEHPIIIHFLLLSFSSELTPL